MIKKLFKKRKKKESASETTGSGTTTVTNDSYYYYENEEEDGVDGVGEEEEEEDGYNEDYEDEGWEEDQDYGDGSCVDSQLPEDTTTSPEQQVQTDSVPGLETLHQIESLLIKLDLDFAKDSNVCCSPKTRFKVMSNAGKQCFFAVDETGCLCRKFCRSNRPFTITFTDLSYREVFRIYRPMSGCCARWILCPCDGLVVTTPGGQSIGFVRQRCALCNTYYVVHDEQDTVRFKVKRSCFGCKCCGCGPNFQFTAYNDIVHLGSWWREEDSVYGLKFPYDLDSKMKAILIGFTFLVYLGNMDRDRSKHTKCCRACRGV